MPTTDQIIAAAKAKAESQADIVPRTAAPISPSTMLRQEQLQSGESVNTGAAASGAALTIAGVEARIADIKKQLANIDAQLTKGKSDTGASLGDLGRMKAAGLKALSDAEAELLRLQPKAATPTNPDNSFARHYQAMGDAQGRGATPEMLGAKPKAASGPVKASDVVEKLKAEDAKNGANFWDVIEAASAGWGGRKSAYAEKKMRETESKTEMDKLIKATELQSTMQAAADARQSANQIKALEKADALEKASKLGIGTIPGLSTTGQAFQSTFLGGK